MEELRRFDCDFCGSRLRCARERPKADFEEEKSEKGTVREDKIRRSKWLCVFECFEKFDARTPYTPPPLSHALMTVFIAAIPIAASSGAMQGKNDFIRFEDRASDHPFVEKVWRCHSERADSFLSVAASNFEMAITRLAGRIFLTLRGPETLRALLSVVRTC